MALSRFYLKRSTKAIGIAAISGFMACGAANAGSVSYKYDSLGRLIQVAYSSGVVINYTYDAAGNRVTEIKTGS